MSKKKTIGGMMAILAGVVYSVFDYKTSVYQCEKCKTLHRPDTLEWVVSPHFFDKRRLMCTKCGDVNWHSKFVVADKNNFN
jgi:hypothetical protein